MSSPIKQIIPYCIDPQLVVTSGTPQRLSSGDLWVCSVIVQSHPSNTGKIYINFTSDTTTSSKGFSLSPEADWNALGDAHRTLGRVFNLKNIWFDGATSGDKIIVQYFI